MTNKDLIELLSKDSRENQQLLHFYNGLRSHQDGHYADSIKEFYQVLEYDGRYRRSNYKYLRDGISHAELTITKTIDVLEQNFRIKCIKNKKSTQRSRDGKKENM